MSTWLFDVLARRPGFEAELVDRYSQRLVAFARQRLPARIRQRIDPEDVVQSVYRSFFRRLQDGSFSFEDSHDIWRLLAAMTFHKVCNVVKFHLRERRDARRDTPLPEAAESTPGKLEIQQLEPRADDVEILFGCLEQILAELPERHRDIVVRRLEGASIEEIAQHVQRTRQTVSRVLSRVQSLGARLLESS